MVECCQSFGITISEWKRYWWIISFHSRSYSGVQLGSCVNRNDFSCWVCLLDATACLLCNVVKTSHYNSSLGICEGCTNGVRNLTVRPVKSRMEIEFSQIFLLQANSQRQLFMEEICTLPSYSRKYNILHLPLWSTSLAPFCTILHHYCIHYLDRRMLQL